MIALPELPRETVDVNVLSRGRSLYAPAGGNLQAAINAAQPGDTIYLEKGAAYVGTFTLPQKAGEGWITIRTLGEIPPPGTRLALGKYNLARISAPGADPAITVNPDARKYRLLGVEIDSITKGTTTWNLVWAKAGCEDFIIDRCYIHGRPDLWSLRGVLLDCKRGAVVNSQVLDIHYAGNDSQAIGVFSGTTIKIVNNALSASCENIMFGGAVPFFENLVPSDIEVRRNHLYKLPEWEGMPKPQWTVKNIFELKSAQRIVVEENVMENCWVHAQTGYAILFTPRTSNGKHHAAVNDVTFRRNMIRDTLAGFTITGRDSAGSEQYPGESKRVLIEGNVVVHRANARSIHAMWGGATVDYTMIGNTFVCPTVCYLGVHFAGKDTSFNAVIQGNVFGKNPTGDSTAFPKCLDKYIPEPPPIEDRYSGNTVVPTNAPIPEDMVALTEAVTAVDAVVDPPPDAPEPPTRRVYGLELTYSAEANGYPLPYGSRRVVLFGDGRRLRQDRDYGFAGDLLIGISPQISDLIADLDVPVER